jgi:hypothetical protein
MEKIAGQEWPPAMTQFLPSARQRCEAARQNDVEFGSAEGAAFRILYEAIVGEGEPRHRAAGQQLGSANASNKRFPSICCSACTPMPSCCSSATMPYRLPNTLSFAFFPARTEATQAVFV